MKKIIMIAAVLLVGITLAASAQGHDFPAASLLNDPQFMQIPAIIAVVYIIAAFIQSLIRQWLEYRLKMRMIEKSVPENVIAQILPPQKQETKTIALKWFSILAGIGVGLLLIGVFDPWGIISMAIMSFSIAFAFLVYYLFSKKYDGPKNTPASIQPTIEQ